MRGFNVGRTPDLVFGSGSIARLAPIAASRGWKRVALVVGRSAIRDAEFRDGLRSSFNAAGVELLVRRYDLIPRDREESLEEAALHERGADPEASSRNVDAIVASIGGAVDAVIAVGGGSAVDTGKAVSAMLVCRESVEVYLEGVGTRAPSGLKLPFVAVPTTAGTGSEATKNAVLSRVGPSGYKKSLRHDNYTPDIALVDPQLALSCPRALTAASGLDAITQLLEAYVSRDATALTDTLALDGLTAAGRGFRRCVERGDSDLPAREEMAYAAYLSGVCLANAGLGTVHGLAGVAGAIAALPHGAFCGLLLPEVTAFGVERLKRSRDAMAALGKYAAAGVALTGRDSRTLEANIDALVERLRDFAGVAALSALGEYGLTRESVALVARTGGNKANPYQFSAEELEELLLRLV